MMMYKNLLRANLSEGKPRRALARTKASSPGLRGISYLQLLQRKTPHGVPSWSLEVGEGELQPTFSGSPSPVLCTPVIYPSPGGSGGPSPLPSMVPSQLGHLHHQLPTVGTKAKEDVFMRFPNTEERRPTWSPRDLVV
ncbi:hypothetical protein Salat_1459500 [Sesamum alatum]|uniref:Uncharacterized protein n=1 Tax=Sesamum alatum TaxID=300844 RepID=A0AAE1YB72_9LAMI|nr:hypothetical protein Salat_1459500 [Sesamum alatum]